VEHYADVPSEKVLLKNIKRIEDGLTGRAKNGHIDGGRLEQTLKDKDHPARDALIWKNFRYNGYSGPSCPPIPVYRAQPFRWISFAETLLSEQPIHK
jgi:hypothetical protein